MLTATTKTVTNVSPTIRPRSTRAHRVVSASSKRWNQTDADADASSSLERLATRACVAATLAATLAVSAGVFYAVVGWRVGEAKRRAPSSRAAGEVSTWTMSSDAYTSPAVARR